jgi:hypothetical protein
MKKIVRLTESDLKRLVKRVIKEQSLINIVRNETDPKKTDCRTNPYWKQLEPKLLSLGFTKKEEHIEKKADRLNIGGYPNVDYYRCSLSHKSGIEIRYPFDMADFTGDYYPDFVEVEGIPEQIMFKNSACVGSPQMEDSPNLKVKCVDYIYGLMAKAIQNKK